jgi:hypothetical protein
MYSAAPFILAFFGVLKLGIPLRDMAKKMRAKRP